MSLTREAFAAPTRNITIHQMTEHDLLEVVEIEEISGLSRWGWAAYYAELQGENKNLMLVARIATAEHRRGAPRLAGYIVGRLGADELHINNVAVRVYYRRLGLGRALLHRILDIGKRSGVANAFLELRAGNSAALALYQECGFHVTARRGRYYCDPVEDALVMTTNLCEALDPAR
ncbi:MAG: [ribosomal protein S18]-alanine N-acetyltransferase [Pyrinomonadaceae bacterium]|jgi:ribosomal-protein-alanine N-acetyltransferase|nr:[ribosomal protein S18]-alanine N-acetyltransferase [Pyrinomonadaceae bacterium]